MSNLPGQRIVPTKLISSASFIPVKIPAQTLFPKLYRAGKRREQVLFWQAEVQGEQWRALSGVLGGKVKIGAWSKCEPTNVGRANMRTGAQQAMFIAKAKQDRLLERGGYFLKKEDIGQAQFVAPMLAHVYDPKNPPPFPLAVQPKYNGARCVITKDGMFTRHGKRYVSAPHIFESVKGLFIHNPELVLDGELYNHRFATLLNRMLSILRKQKPTIEELAFSRRYVRFYAYDCFQYIRGQAETEGFGVRYDKLRFFVRGLPYVELTPTFACANQTNLKKAYEQFLKEGFEGAILRDIHADYEHDRTKALLKYKPRYSADFIITAVSEGNGKRKGMAATITFEIPAKEYEGGFVVKTATTGKATLKGTDAFKIQTWNERKILPRTLATVSYAYITEYGRAFHPVVETLWKSSNRI